MFTVGVNNLWLSIIFGYEMRDLNSEFEFLYYGVRSKFLEFLLELHAPLLILKTNCQENGQGEAD